MIKKRSSRNLPEKNKVIISCEDSRDGASYKYFDLIRKKFNLQQLIQIIPSTSKSAPLAVAKRAKKSYVEGDSVFIVVDKDQHKHEDAIAFLKKSQIQKYDYILSNPCFEYWLLLHEKCTDTQFEDSQSLCKELSKVLKNNNIKHHKTMDYSYFVDSKKIKKATLYCKKNYKKNDSPSTNIHLLIDKLNSNSNIY